MDNTFTVPGTSIKLGWDSIMGLLLPGAGDAASAVSHVALLLAAFQARVSKLVIARMVLNAAIDALVGVVPGLGDVFDVAWKANARNLELLERAERRGTHATIGDYLFVRPRGGRGSRRAVGADRRGDLGGDPALALSAALGLSRPALASSRESRVLASGDRHRPRSQHRSSFTKSPRARTGTRAAQGDGRRSRRRPQPLEQSMQTSQTTKSPKAPKLPRNGVDTPTLFATINAVGAQPELAKFQFRATTAGAAARTARRRSSRSAGRAANTITSASSSSAAIIPQCCAARITRRRRSSSCCTRSASCLTAGIANIASARGVTLHSVESRIEGDIDLQGILGLSNTCATATSASA